MKGFWIVAAAVALTALAFSGCTFCSGLIPGFGGTHAVISGMTGRSGVAVSNGGTTTDRVQSVYGTIENPSGSDAATFGGKVILELNGNSQYVTPERNVNGTWDFSGDLVIRRGVNTLIIYVDDLNGNHVYTSMPYVITGDLPQRKIESVLTWNTDDNDVDMHIYSPNDEHTYYSDLTAIPGCNLDLDDTDGYGPETFTCENNTVESGTWTIKVRYYSDHGVTSPVIATIRVTRNEGTAQTFTHTFTADQANGDDDANDWTVTTFTMP